MGGLGGRGWKLDVPAAENGGTIKDRWYTSRKANRIARGGEGWGDVEIMVLWLGRITQ